MGMKGRDNDPILDVNDVLWWAGIGMLTFVVVLVWLSDVPWWAALVVTLVCALVNRPLYKRYMQQAEAKRPHR